MGIPIIGDIISAVVGKAGDIASELIVDKDKKIQLAADLARLQVEMTDKAEQRVHDEMIAQIEVNKTEASNSNLFVAGWRPAVGWVGVVGLGYTFIVEPFAEFIARMFHYTGQFPQVQTESLLFLISGMLGFGGLRTWEKVKGIVSPNPSPLEPTAAPSRAPIDLVPDVLKATPPENAPW
jgi:hypothetical protein